MENIYKLASRRGLRFGNYTVEQLWSLDLTSKRANVDTLDSIAKALHKRISETTVTSFVTETKTEASEDDQLRFKIVLDVIRTRKDEAALAAQEHVLEHKRAKLQAIQAERAESKYVNMTDEELAAELAALGK